MGLIARRFPWVTQPQFFAPLNASNPLTSSIKNLLVAAPWQAAMQPYFGGFNSLGGYGTVGLYKRVTSTGTFQGHVSTGYRDDSRVPSYQTDAFGIIIFAHFHKVGSASNWIVRSSGGSFQNDGSVVLNANGSLTVTANGDLNVTTAAGVCGDGHHTVVFANYRVAGVQRLWLDGRLLGSWASTGQQGFSTNEVLTGQEAVGDVSIGYVGHASGWNDQAWATALANNPWQLFAPRRQFLPFAAASGIPTLSGLTFIDITANSARPRVTLTF